MGVVQDPHGAYFCVWQPKDNIGAKLVNAPGALVLERARDLRHGCVSGLLPELFGWKTEPFEGSEIPYYTIQTADGHGNGGIRPAMEGEPNYWLVYFGAEDIGTGLARAGELGGNTIVPRTSIGCRRDRDRSGTRWARCCRAVLRAIPTVIR